MATPDFIKEMRKVRSEIMTVNEFSRIIGIKTSREATATAMRAMNIVGAFSRSESIRSVESGDLDNHKFVIAMQSAVNFMRTYGEAEVNRDFDDWIVENLMSESEKITILDEKEVNLAILL